MRSLRPRPFNGIATFASLILAACVALLPLAHVSAQQKTASPSPKQPAFTEEQIHKLADITARVQRSTAELHYLDALTTIREADEIAPDSALVWNLRGSVYTAFRDFDKAREAFTKARDSMPQSFEPRFNLAEILYVEQKYAEAEAAFTELQKGFPKMREVPRHLCLFKILVCRLKQDNKAGAEEIMKNFGPTDDTAAYYYAKAVFALHSGKNEEGGSWLSQATHTFTKEQNAIYIDAINEAKWVRPTASTEPKVGEPAPTLTPSLTPEVK